jgi:hypothetical protein
MRTEEYLNLDKKLMAEINRVASKQYTAWSRRISWIYQINLIVSIRFFTSTKKRKLNDGTALILNDFVEQDTP